MPGCQWMLADLIEELQAIDAFAATKPDENNLHIIVEQFGNRVKACCPGGMKDTLALLDAVKQSKLPEPCTQKLASIAESRPWIDDASHLKLQSCGQVILTPWNYMSETEWKTLPSLTIHEMFSLIVAKLKKCGIKSLKEKRKLWIMALVLHLYMKNGKAQPSLTEIWNNVLTTTFKMESTPALWPGQPNYPKSPSEMGEDFLKKVYGADLIHQPERSSWSSQFVPVGQVEKHQHRTHK